MKGKGLGVCAVLGVLFAMLLAWSTPVSAYAADNVAKVGDTYYESLDTAVEEAAEGSTIELLRDCELSVGFNKTLTFTGGHKITINKQLTSNGEGWMCFGLYDTSRVLTFDGVEVEWNSEVGTAPWLMLSLSGTLNVDNGAKVVFTVDSGSTGSRNAIYLNAGSSINVTNGSTFEIHGYSTDGKEGQGLQLDKTGTATVNVKGGSTFLIDGTNRGYVNSPTINVEDSNFFVKNCTSNGSNGGEFTAINSTVVYENNNGHGLSAGNVTIKNSTFDCNNNAYYGLTYSGNMTMDATSTINANGNGYGYTGGGLRAYGTSTVEANAEINILNNQRNGMENYGTFSMKDGVKFTVTGNREPSTNGGGIYNGGTLILPSNADITDNYAAQTGGGICNAGTVTIPGGVTGVKLYNNHAGQAGDDLFNRESATVEGLFATGEWSLDGERISGFEGVGAEPTHEAFGCTDGIDGWYYDAADARWDAHADAYDGVHVEEYAFDGNTTTVTGPLALKAAHGLGTVTVDPADITIYMGGTTGYEGVTSGGAITGSNSLPEPGFYIELPKDVNAALQAAGVSTEGEGANLSDYLKIYTHGYNGETGELHWKLEPYGDTYSGAYERYIYRIVPDPTDGQEAVPVRLQFTDDGGSVTTSDTFAPSEEGALNQHYTMQLYTELVQNDQVVFEVTVEGAHYYSSMELETGDLNVRYVTGGQNDVVTGVLNSVEDLAAAKEDDASKAYAVLPSDAQYFVNGSQVDVTTSATPSLLFDSIVSDHNTEGAGDYDQQLANRAVDVAAEAGTTYTHPWYEAKYLDLVDASNGNVWLTSSEPVTVYWPYPVGTDENTEFTLVHFEGLDREMSNGEVENNIASAKAVSVEVENTPYGIKFATNGFSPFVLMWEGEGEQPAPEDTKKPSTGNLAQTGDNSMALIAGVGAAGVACLGAALAVKKHSKGEE